jgi:5-hydroxyisourate hydrolase
MNTLSTHVLDTSLGRPASGIHVSLEQDGTELGRGVTDTNGRIADIRGSKELGAGTYRLRFEVAEYFARTDRSSLFPEVVVIFRVGGGHEHYHIPVLLTPFGYTTYRGS